MEPAIRSLLTASSGPLSVDPRVARANTIAERFENGDIEGALEFFVDEVKMPVLLMGGEKTVGVLTNILNEAQKCLPSAQRVTIPNAAHRMSRDNPAAFNRALVEFLLQ